jgi:hypothetical protein
MKIFIPFFFLALLLFDCASRATQTKRNINTHNKNSYMDKKRVEKQKGVVGFWNEIDKYTISFEKENTIDGQFTCIISDSKMIPEQFKKVGTHVIFSGTIKKDAQLPPARMGGEQIFFLAELENIKSYNN